ncbi:MAG: S8 family serine peptidase [Ignavibacteriae bacterium]|nr:S8 family serine peptidase [Ignavibacteriota bacterium]
MIKKIFTFAFILLISASLFAQEKPDTKYWIIFKDKGLFKNEGKIFPGTDAYNEAIALLSDRAIQRRLKVIPEENLIDFGDLPLELSYVSEIEKLGIDLIAKSKWLNGISAYLTKSQLEKVKKLDFVFQIKTVKKLYKQNIVSLAPVECGEHYNNNFFISKDIKNILNYGKSFDQMNQIDVPKVHNLGINGKGVLVASFDDGFFWKNHEALKELKVIEEFDFINKDENTAIEVNQKYTDTREQGGHGTATFSTMAGFKEGKLIGPAFNSEFLLAKTEYVASETPMEEDFWLEAAEWVESKGADIITSSLIYKEFDKPYSENSYKYENYDGKTCITTIAASRCAYLGIVVLNAMGNYYQTEIPSLGSAADGDTIISVGAVDSKGNIAYFSSNGPTSDGRTKPDVCAMGFNVFAAQKEGTDKYDLVGGTSFSTPITAGVCALILSAHPELTPLQVREALRMTANNFANPNNIYGWGIINAYNALLYYGMAWSNEAAFTRDEYGIKVSVSLASQYLIDGNSVKIFYSADEGITFEEMNLIYIQGNDDGNKSGLYTAALKQYPVNTKLLYYFTARNSNNEESVYPPNAHRNKIKCLSYNF